MTAALRLAALVTGLLVVLSSTACHSQAPATQATLTQPPTTQPQAMPTIAGMPPGFVKPASLPTLVPGPALSVTSTVEMTFEDDTITAYDFADDDHGWVAVGSTILVTADGGQHS